MATPLSDQSKNQEETEVTSAEQGVDQVNAGELDYHSLMRHNSIYSLTLDEIQNTVCEPGRNFGSMNMDEFLTNIWNADESGQPAPPQPGGATAPIAGADVISGGLQGQGSLSVPAPLSRKTVEEVWTEINQVHGRPTTHVPPRGASGPLALNCSGSGGVIASGRQATFGEMTLEDFLIKAGVVREPMVNLRPVAPPQAPIAPPPAGAQAQFGPMGGFHVAPAGEVYGVNDTVMSVMMEEEELGGEYSERGRKRTLGGAGLDGGVEKVVERRQRRMIKNRESAARSRARKQAYTVELEAELNQLKEENMRLKEEEKKVLALRRQMLLDSMAERSHANVEKARATLRRSTTCVW